jgi:Arc/MetJ-type ribon-helix-helix transcriptional regulator
VTQPKAASVVKTTLSFRVPAEQLVEIDEEILKDHRKSRSDLVEPIWDWAWKEYKKAGSLRALLGVSRPRARSTRVSEETQEQLYMALETILERAPSAVIEDVARMLTARAGKYGEPKTHK